MAGGRSFRVHFLQLGFLDGRMGFALAVANAEEIYYRCLKAWVAADGTHKRSR
jgi:hypothetical protein